MNFPEEIKKIRQRSFLSQDEFAKEIGVAFSTVNRWEGAKAKPNLAAMKSIKEYCRSRDIDFSSVEEAWLNYIVESKKI
ncbi:MAG: helix-turn-helix domain-containing protein [Anaerostipes sp.]|jgi:putative transcriptional regulator|nr:helix-turn-helix domain-containing protein [Anaerostipes sp.]MDD3747184.1 helix-turn-helix domain-containing protein [Anaerostipes sp.]